MSPRQTFAALCLILAWLLAPRLARAHEADPIGVGVLERPSGEVTVRVARPAAVQRAWPIAIEPPSGCEVSGAPSERREGARVVAETRWSCRGSLRGAQLELRGLAEAERQAVLRVELADGTTVRGVVRPEAGAFVVPERSAWHATVSAFVALGARHFAAGLDHLLFVLGLVLLARELRRTALAVTAFTIGHSLTLCASVLGWVRFPSALAELGIAASLVYLAVQVASGARAGRGLPAVVFALGLLHGLGFAAALTEAGLPAGEVPLALASFNLGVELAQLSFVAAAFALSALSLRAGAQLGERPRVWVGHAIGALAALWCFERGLALFS